MSKCAFGVLKVECLDHFISDEGVSTDPKKIVAVQQQPVSSNIKQLRGFLGIQDITEGLLKGLDPYASHYINYLRRMSSCGQ